MSTTKLNHVIQIAVMAAIMLILSYLPGIPLGPIPIVLENLGVMLAGLLLGSKRGTITILLFILLKVIGLSGTSGLALLLGPTCGYVYGWIFVPFFMNGFLKIGPKHPNFWGSFLIIAAVNVIIVDLIGGSLGLALTLHFPMVKAIVYNLLFAPGDIIKALIATAIYHQAMKSTHMRNLLN